MSGAVDFDVAAALRKRQALIKERQRALDVQVVKDSNYFCPEESGDLKRSALRSDFGSGRVAWNTPYAKKQYYQGPNKSKDKNPNATVKWFEEAKSRMKKKWLEMING